VLQRFAIYRVLRIAGVALPAIAAYRWLEMRERHGRPASPAAWDRVHDRTARPAMTRHPPGGSREALPGGGARADNFPGAKSVVPVASTTPSRPVRSRRCERRSSASSAARWKTFSTMDERAIAASLAQVPGHAA
jgi:hypothetical protein